MRSDEIEEFRRELGAFVAEHISYLRSVANKMAPDFSQADDLVQETLLVAMQKAETFDTSREIRPWLVGILRNLARRAWRRAMQEDKLKYDGLAEFMDQISEEPSEIFSDEARNRLEQCLDRLQERARKILNLRYTVGMRSHEIGSVVGSTGAAVRVALGRIRQRLRECIGSVGTMQESDA